MGCFWAKMRTSAMLSTPYVKAAVGSLIWMLEVLELLAGFVRRLGVRLLIKG
jgi:hypothetical protein